MHLPMPEKLRDLSLRHKILFANFLMVAVPVLLIAVLGTLVFAGLRFTGTLRQTELALLWPERGAAMSVSYAVSDLRWQSEHHGRIGAQRFEESCHLLEQKGIQVVILAGKDRSSGKGRPPGPQGSPGKDAPAGRPEAPEREQQAEEREVVYASPGADAETIARQAVRSLGGPAVSGMRWQRNEFAFVHHARSGCAVYAYGHLPLPAPGQHDAEAESMRSAVEGIAFGLFLLAICFILWLGLFLARLISRQVLDPLARLRQAAEEVGRGRLDGRIEVRAHDEVGETCACFDRMRQDLAAARAEQQRYEQGRRELLAGISHDLSTPLTAIGGYASGLADGIADTPEKRRHYADRITALVAQLSRLVDRLFLFSRLDLGRVTFHLKTVALDGCLRAWLAEARATQEPGEEISYAAAPEAAGLCARLDREEFFRVLENLWQNSRKYAADAEGRLSAELSLMPGERGEARILWRDHGPGVPPEALPHLFESFYRVDKSRGEKPGHGLGMAIASRIVTGMGGRIWAELPPDGGLAVVMAFPTVRREERENGNEEHLDHRG
jgi:signal transduction histidine kinase